jgi:hypothetical protein
MPTAYDTRISGFVPFDDLICDGEKCTNRPGKLEQIQGVYFVCQQTSGRSRCEEKVDKTVSVANQDRRSAYNRAWPAARFCPSCHATGSWTMCLIIFPTFSHRFFFSYP